MGLLVQNINIPKPRYLVPFVVFVAYICWALFLTGATGHLANIDQVFASEYDARGYLLYSDFLIGRGDTHLPPVAALRPFLFPLFLGLRPVVGVVGFVLLQFVLNGLTVVLVMTGIHHLTRSTVATYSAMVPFFTSVSFTFLALHALAESLAMVLVAAFLFFFSGFSATRDSRLFFLSVFVLSLAVCAKPVFFPALLVMVLMGGVMFIRLAQAQRTIRPGAVIAMLVLSVVPILVQLSITFAISGRPVISRAGTLNFTTRFFPAVVGYVEDGRIGRKDFLAYNQPDAQEAAARFPGIVNKGRFLAAHPLETAIVTHFLLVEMNLQAASPHVVRPVEAVVNEKAARRLVRFSRRVNHLMTGVHAFFLPVVAIGLWLASREIRYVIVAAAVLNYCVLLLSALSYWQGDRLITAALPAWTFLYCLVAWTTIRAVLSCRSRGESEKPTAA